MGITHPFVSGKADGGDATLVQPSDWNDAHTGGLFYPSGTPALYVAASGGSDSNDGLSPTTAKATVAGAYSALPSTGGIIWLLPGRHDLTTGLVLTKGKRLALRGLGHWQRAATAQGNATWDTGGGAVVFTSEASPPVNLISWTNANDNEEGFELRNVVVECKSGVTCAVRANGVVHGLVEDCAFFMKDTTSTAIIIDHSSGVTGNDASWWRIAKNYCAGGGSFFESGQTSNHNQIVIVENVCFRATTGTMITLRGGHRCVIRDNNLEGDQAGPFIKLISTKASTLIGNGGEVSTAGTVNTFCQLDASSGNLLMDQGTSTPNAGDDLYEFINGSQDNLAIIASVTDSATQYDGTSIDDQTTNKKNAWMHAGTTGSIRGVWLPWMKQGSGSPNSVVWGHPGNLYLDTAGGAGVTLYVKESGSGTTTGWVAVKSFAAHVLDSADHTISGKTAGQFLRATSATAFAFEAVPFSVGGVVLDPTAARTIRVWTAPFACTVTDIQALVIAGTNAVINAQRNTVDLRSADATVTAGTDYASVGGTLQNQAFAAGDDLAIEIVSVSGAVTMVGIQVNFTRP